MPLRDHFRPPVNKKHSWDELHGGWPMMLVQRLNAVLPPRYISGPTVHLGPAFEIDVSAFEEDGAAPSGAPGANGAGGVAVALQTTLAPTLTVQTDSFGQDEYEVRVYDEEHGRTLVAAIEIVSPANKDRPDTRRVFAAKCAALLDAGVCVSVVDVVTVKQFNLYADLLELIGVTDPALKPKPPAVYAVTLRGRKPPKKRPVLDAWFHPLVLGQPFPSLPLWLATDLVIALDLESSYEDACRVLRIA